jgi:hypothetical protein
MNPLVRPIVAHSSQARQFFYWCVRQRLLQLENNRRISGENWLKAKRARVSRQIERLYVVKHELEELDE